MGTRRTMTPEDGLSRLPNIIFPKGAERWHSAADGDTGGVTTFRVRNRYAYHDQTDETHQPSGHSRQKLVVMSWG